MGTISLLSHSYLICCNKVAKPIISKILHKINCNHNISSSSCSSSLNLIPTTTAQLSKYNLLAHRRATISLPHNTHNNHNIITLTIISSKTHSNKNANNNMTI